MAGRQITNLQVLRGVAAFLIVIYHVQPLLNRLYAQSLHSHSAIVGVDIFFVLSGFVMFYSNPEPQPGAAGRFLVQRFFRIVPLYWLATAAIIAFFLIGYRPVGLHALSPRIVAESLAFIPSSFPQGRHDLILTVGWTLMFELFFYLSFALTFGLRSLEKSFAILTAAFLALSLFGQMVHPLPSLLEFYTSPIMLEFLFGAALALLYLRWSRPAPQWLPVAGLSLLLAGFAASFAQDAAHVPLPNKHDLRFLVLGLPALLVVAGTLAMERGGWVLKQRFFVELGAASYALYLFHPLILQIAVTVVKPVLPASPAVAGIVAVTACVGAAFAIHWWVEQPILSAARQLIRRAPRQPAAAALAIQPAE